MSWSMSWSMDLLDPSDLSEVLIALWPLLLLKQLMKLEMANHRYRVLSSVERSDKNDPRRTSEPEKSPEIQSGKTMQDSLN